MAGYTIKKGDTLSKIARAYGTTVENLAKANNISNVNRIRAGGTLNIPGNDGVTFGDADVQLEPDYTPGQGTTQTGAAGGTLNTSTAQTVAGQAADPSAILGLMQQLQYPQYSAPDLSGAYTAAGNQYASALEAAYQAQKAQLEKQQADLGKQYEALRSREYVNRRLSAIGNNEMLAAQGLAGSLYAGPQSGVSESSRIAQDVALRSNLSNISAQEQAQIDAIAAEIIQAGYTKDIQTAQYLAELSIKQAEAQAEQANRMYQSQLGGYNAQMGMYETLLGDYYNRESLKMQQEAHDLEQAMGKLKLSQAQKKAGRSGRSGSKLSSDGTALARKIMYTIDPATPDYKLGNTINELRGTLGSYSGQYTQEAINEANHLLYESAVAEGMSRNSGGRMNYGGGKYTMSTR